MVRTGRRSAGLLTAAWCLTAPAAPAPALGRRSIVLITLDTTRDDYVGGAGSGLPELRRPQAGRADRRTGLSRARRLGGDGERAPLAGPAVAGRTLLPLGPLLRSPRPLRRARVRPGVAGRGAVPGRDPLRR